MLKVTNLAQVKGDLDRWLAASEVMATKAVVSYAGYAYHILLGRSPQFSGDFVANWNVSLNTPDYNTFRPFTATRNDGTKRGRGFGLDDANYKMGDKPAMTEGKRRNAGTLQNFKLGDKIYFANNSRHLMGVIKKFDFYARKVEDDQINWRPGNVHAGHPTGVTKFWMTTRYAVLDKKTIAGFKAVL